MKIVTAIIALFVEGWLAMLLLGVAHGADPRVPALSYGVTLALGVAISMFTHDHDDIA